MPYGREKGQGNARGLSLLKSLQNSVFSASVGIECVMMAPFN